MAGRVFYLATGSQYLLLDGSRAMTGKLDMGTNDITNVGTVDGVDVSSHASRHHDGGADEITAQLLGSGAATSGQIMETNGVGGWTLIATPSGGGGNTLDQAYDEGGAGAGRSISATAGAVDISDGSTGTVLRLSQGSAAAPALNLRADATTDVAGLFTGSGTLGVSAGGSTSATFWSNRLDLGGNYLANADRVVFDQRASKPTPGASHGLVYLKNTSPTTLYFVDSGGTEHQLGTGGGGSTSLDGAYNNGSTITADAGAVTINASASTGTALALTEGSATTPSLTVRDANTGVYSSAADTLDFATGGTQGLQINSSQQLVIPKVGGTSTLSIRSGMNSDQGISFRGGGGTGVVRSYLLADTSRFIEIAGSPSYTCTVSNAHFRPNNNDTLDCGRTGNRWKGVYGETHYAKPGSTSAGFSFDGDTDTIIYQPSASPDTMTIRTGGVDAVTIDSSQVVRATHDGIGSTETDALSVENTTAATSGVINQQSPTLAVEGQYWNGTASAQNKWGLIAKHDGTDPIMELGADINGSGWGQISRWTIDGKFINGANLVIDDGVDDVEFTNNVTASSRSASGDVLEVVVNGTSYYLSLLT